jgi:hypothetical protein
MNSALGAYTREGENRIIGLRLKEIFLRLREGDAEGAVRLVNSLVEHPKFGRQSVMLNYSTVSSSMAHRFSLALPISPARSSLNITEEQQKAFSRLGALEVIGLHLREGRVRRLAAGFLSILAHGREEDLLNSERRKHLEQVHELREENLQLLEDNENLRSQNTALIENLEQTNQNFSGLTTHLEHMRVSRLIRMLCRLTDTRKFLVISRLQQHA